MSCSRMRTCGEPRQHRHYYQYRTAAACSCPCCHGSSAASSSSVVRTHPISSHYHTQRRLLGSSSGTHTHCPLRADVLAGFCALLPTEHPHCSFRCEEHTHCPFHPVKHTHSTPCPYPAPSERSRTPHPLECTHITPSRARTHLSPLSQYCTFNDTDLYAAPLKKPKRPKKQYKIYPPPFPSLLAPPYILCQHCFKLLSLPFSPPLHLLSLASVVKLKCALCMQTSFFSTRDRHNVTQLRNSDASNAARSITGGDFCFKVEQRSSEEDHVPTIDASPKDERLLLEVGRKSMDVHVPTTDTEAYGAGPLRNEQEIVDANVIGNEAVTEECAQGIYSSPHSSPKLNPEFAGFSSVQDWVNSLEEESYLHCPTPLIGNGFGSDLQLQGPLDWQIDYEQGCEKFNLPVPGSPLHEHFGYKSPTELLNKNLSSDDEIKMPSDTTSSASTSATSANTFKPPGFESVDQSVRKRIFKIALVKQGSKNSTKSVKNGEQNDQGTLANLLRRGFKEFGDWKSSPGSSTKSRVIVNGHTLSQLALKKAEEQAGKLRPGTYWYDSKAGFWGVSGGPCLGVLPPFIEELHYPMSGDCSNGDTQVFVNGRELHQKDLAVLAHRGLSKKEGRVYEIDFDGVVIDSTSGLELKHLGKLAPTVERRGKGFGMYMAKQ